MAAMSAIGVRISHAACRGNAKASSASWSFFFIASCQKAEHVAEQMRNAWGFVSRCSRFSRRRTVVPEAGIEPARLAAGDFESGV